MKVSDLKVASYQLVDATPQMPIGVTLDRCVQRDGPDLWAIREGGACLDKQGDWVLEPLPSSRDAVFFSSCRWKSAELALEFWERKGHSRFDHYRAGR